MSRVCRPGEEPRPWTPSTGIRSALPLAHLTPTLLAWKGWDLRVPWDFLWGKVEPQTWAQAMHLRILSERLALGPWATYLLSVLISPQCIGKTHSSHPLNPHGCWEGTQSHLPFLIGLGVTYS